MSFSRIAKALLYLCAVAAGIGGLSLITDLADSNALRSLEIWRAIGLFFFAGIFVILANRGGALQELWLLTIASKVALVVLTAALLQGSERAEILLVDGILCIVLVAAFAANRKALDRERATGV